MDQQPAPPGTATAADRPDRRRRGPPGTATAAPDRRRPARDRPPDRRRPARDRPGRPLVVSP
jgi:hypothetical protein